MWDGVSFQNTNRDSLSFSVSFFLFLSCFFGECRARECVADRLCKVLCIVLHAVLERTAGKAGGVDSGVWVEGIVAC